VSSALPTTEEFLARLEASMESLSDSVPSFKAMIYGVSGVGKTVHSMMIAQEITPPDRWILYIDTAEGWVSLNNHEKEMHLKRRTERMRYMNLNQLEALCRMTRDGVGKFGSLGCIVFDESSSAADQSLDEVLKMRAAADRSKDPDTPTQPDYNTTTNRVRKTYMDLLTLPGVHVILVSHARKDKDNRNVEVVAPSFLPKLGQKLKQPLHMIANLSGNELDDEKYVRIFQVHPTRRIDAKTRVGGLKPQVEYDALIVKVKGWLGGDVPDQEHLVLVPDRDPEQPVPQSVEDIEE